MKRRIVGYMAAATFAASFAGVRSAEPLQLTTERVTYPYDPAEAGPKGSGDLGQAETPIQMGARVMATCIERPASDTANEGLFDAVRLANEPYRGYLIPIRVHPAQKGEIAADPVNVFDMDPDEIRGRLGLC